MTRAAAIFPIWQCKRQKNKTRKKHIKKYKNTNFQATYFFFEPYHLASSGLKFENYNASN